MKVLFVYPNINGFHENCYSPGLGYLVSATKTGGHQVKVILIRSKADYTAFLECLTSFNPDVVGFSSVSSQYAAVKELAAITKTHNDTICTVCGGIHPTINPDCLFETDYLDGLFIGECEQAFPEFLERLERSLSVDKCDNFAYIRDGKLVVNPLKPLQENLDALPFPDKEIYPYEAAIGPAGYAPFFFSRGCPFDCYYCCNHAIAARYNIERNWPRYRSAGHCIREIEDALKRFDMERIVIRDDIFGLEEGWRHEFCCQYKRHIARPFTVMSRVDVISDGYLHDLKHAGCSTVSLAIESGNDLIRNTLLGKTVSKEQIMVAFERVHKFGIESNAINMIGIPSETEEMIWETIVLNRMVNPNDSRVNIYHPYRGTKLGDSCFTNGMVNKDKCKNFFAERRDTVLNFDDEHIKRLIYFRENWKQLIYMVT